MKKGLKRFRKWNEERLKEVYSKLMPWWRRDWNLAILLELIDGIVYAVNWCPDEEGIETASSATQDKSMRCTVNWCPDEEGIETFDLPRGRERLRTPVNWCPDEEGIETARGAGRIAWWCIGSKLMPWWRRDWNLPTRSIRPSALASSKLMPWWRRDWNKRCRDFFLGRKRMYSKLMPWWRRDWNPNAPLWEISMVVQ